MNTLTVRQAYLAMFHFLDGIWCSRNSEFHYDLPILLGSMQFLWDGEPGKHTTPGDPAMWNDWLRCIPHEDMSVEEAFNAMLMMLDIYRTRGDTGEIRKVLNELKTEDAKQRWFKYVREL